MTPLWSAAEAAAACAGRLVGTWAVDAVSIDTRTLPERALFVALKGDSRDGHAFLGEAAAKGAAVLVARGQGPFAPDLPRIEVEDTLAGLECLGRAARARSAAGIVAVTGSVGKTGTKEALRTVLAGQSAVHASEASYNNHWGVPLSLARLPREARWGVFELGMSHAGEIRPLTHMVRPHVGLVTAIAPAHLANLGSMEAIADAKAELFEGLAPGGIAVLPRDDAWFERLAARARRCGATVLSFGAHAAADWRLVRAEPDGVGSRLLLERRGRRIEARLRMAGVHRARNAAGVLAAVEALGADAGLAASALAEVEAAPGRGQQRPLRLAGGEALLLDESYNANPASVRAAIAVLGEQPGRRLAVLGDMRELGPQAPAMHADLAQALEAADVAQVFTCGALMAHLHDALPAARRGAHAADSAALAPLVREAVRPGDAVLVKGSLATAMKRVVAALDAAREA